MGMKIYDVTRPLERGMLVYPGDLPPSFIQEERGHYLVSDLRMSTHTGTHIDAPVHYLKSGDTVDTIPLNDLIGRCRVLDVRGAGSTITAEYLHGRIAGVERLLLKTTFSGTSRFTEEYPCLSLDAAQAVTRTGIRCVGIDSLSIESFHCDGSVHRELLGHGCSIIELLDLSQVTEGDYTMIALPLRLKGLDGSPARVVLYTDDDEG
jgi:arylformamidase